MKKIIAATFDEDFSASWLVEMPMGISPLSNNLFNGIVNNMQEFKQAGLQPDDLGNGYYRLEGSQVAFYWHEANGVIDIIAELGVRPQSLVMHQIAKNPNSTTSTFATELYPTIIRNNNKSLVLISDEYLTDQGLNVWIRLLNLGYPISVYDRENPKQGLTPLKTQTQLMQFFKSKDATKKRYQYVLSGSDAKLGESMVFFNTKRLRILSGYPE